MVSQSKIDIWNIFSLTPRLPGQFCDLKFPSNNKSPLYLRDGFKRNLHPCHIDLLYGFRLIFFLNPL